MRNATEGPQTRTWALSLAVATLIAHSPALGAATKAPYPIRTRDCLVGSTQALTGAFVPMDEAQPAANQAARTASSRADYVANRINNLRARQGKPPLTEAEQASVFSRVYSRRDGGVIFFDTPQTVEGLPVPKARQGVVFDHHGPYFDSQDPRNSTEQFLDYVERGLQAGKGPQARTVAGLRHRIGRVSTDNLGDGGWAVWISQNLERVAADPSLRQLIRDATRYEDFEHFGYLDIQKLSPSKQKAVELQQAIFQRYERILEDFKITGSDRFNALPGPLQRDLMQKAQQAITELVDSATGRSGDGGILVREEAAKFKQHMADAAAGLQRSRQSIADEVAPGLARLLPAGQTAPAFLDELGKDVLVFDSGKLSGGFFSRGGATYSPATRDLFQLNMKTLPNGKTWFVLANPYGRKLPFPLKSVGERILQLHLGAVEKEAFQAASSSGKSVEEATALAKAARQSAASAVGGRNDLQFSFAGVNVPKDRLLYEVALALQQEKAALSRP